MSGFILGRMKLKRFIEPWVFDSAKRCATYESEKLGFNGRLAKGLESVRDVVGFNRASAELELLHFGQELFEMAVESDGRFDEG